jgi:hypothetical protein
MSNFRKTTAGSFIRLSSLFPPLTTPLFIPLLCLQAGYEDGGDGAGAGAGVEGGTAVDGEKGKGGSAPAPTPTPTPAPAPAPVSKQLAVVKSALTIKDAGNQLFKSKSYEAAIVKYKEVGGRILRRFSAVFDPLERYDGRSTLAVGEQYASTYQYTCFGGCLFQPILDI